MTEPSCSLEEITADTLEALDDAIVQLRRTLRDIEANKVALHAADRAYTKWTIVSNINSIMGSELPLGLPLLRLARNEEALQRIDSSAPNQESSAMGGIND